MRTLLQNLNAPRMIEGLLHFAGLDLIGSASIIFLGNDATPLLAIDDEFR